MRQKAADFALIFGESRYTRAFQRRGGQLCPPAECTDFSEIHGKFATFIRPTESSAPTEHSTNSPKGFRFSLLPAAQPLSQLH